MSAEHRNRKREDANAQITVDTKTGAWEASAKDGTVIARGEVTKARGRLVLHVPLAYDASIYFDTLVDRERALSAAARAIAALTKAGNAKTPAEARELANAVLADPLVTDVREEARRDAWRREQRERKHHEGGA